MSIYAGIDLGTSNSAIAVHRLETEILTNGDGETVTPSCVMLRAEDGDVRPLVGRRARNLQKQHPQDTIVSVKRLMGRAFGDPEVQAIVANKKTNYLVETDPLQPGSVLVSACGKQFNPETISSYILKKLVDDAKVALGNEVSQVVVTVPAYFSDRQKHATRTACELAGLKVQRLLPEPTAAAVSFGVREMSKDDAQTVMVFDLGGGTFDLSILSVVDGQFMEVTKGGDMWLGGDDIDAVIRDIVFKKFNDKNPETNLSDLLNIQPDQSLSLFKLETLEACEKAKIALGSESETQVEIFGTLRDKDGKLVDIDVAVTRAEFDRALEPLVEKLLKITQNTLIDVNFNEELIDIVLMVGGSSLVPCIQDALRKRFGEQKVRVHPRPLYAVVEGAAIMAQCLSSADITTQKVNLMQSAAHPYFLQLANGQRRELVKRNAPMPACVTESLTFVSADQVLARLRVLNEIDGILEPVGELWAFRHEIGPLDQLDLGFSEKKVSLNLDFEVDSDNIITMSASISDKKVNTSIVRRAVAISLFHELEACLARMTVAVSSALHFDDFLHLSRVVVGTIQELDKAKESDVEEMRLKVRKQISVLESLPKVLSPRWFMLLTGTMLDYAADLFEKKELSEFQDAYRKLECALLDMTDLSLITKLVEGFNFEDESFVERVFAIEAITFALQIRKIGKRDCDKLLREVRAYASACKSNNTFAKQACEMAIYEVMSNYDSSTYTGKATFHRDVQLA